MLYICFSSRLATLYVLYIILIVIFILILIIIIFIIIIIILGIEQCCMGQFGLCVLFCT